MSARRRRGLTVVEILIGIVFFSTLAYFCYTLMAMSSRRSAATTRKNDTLRAVLDVAGRVRRDVKWAIQVDLEHQGRLMRLTGHDGTQRLWYFDKTKRQLVLPSITDPTKQAQYKLADFREFKVWRVEGTCLFKYVVAALPPEAGAGSPSKVDLKYSTTVAGEVCCSRELGVSQNALWDGK